MSDPTVPPIADLFAADGPLAAADPSFAPRPHQTDMATAVADALDRARHLIVEAGTGVGKSLAYLLPAALWAATRGKKVVVSTFTKALQEQLMQKDLPLVRDALARLGVELRYAVLMGADNYLCVDRLRRAQRGGREFFEEPAPTDLLDTLDEWARTSNTGLRTRLPLAVPAATWDKIRRDPDLCLAGKDDLCLYKKDLARAREAHIVVVNHHLFFAGTPLAPPDAVIFDEAHTLETAAAEFLGVEVSDRGLQRLEDDIHAALFFKSTKRAVIDRELRRRRVEDALRAIKLRSTAFFEETILRTGLTAGEPSKRLRGPLPVEDTLSTPLEELDTLLGETVETASSSEEEAAFRSLRGRAKDIRTGIRRFFSPPPEDHAAWVERAPGRRAGLRMRSVPVDVSEELKIRLFESFPTVVLTSATLAVAGSFATLRGRVGVDVAEEKLLDSPFDYPRRAALFLPETPDPKTDADAHERAVTERCVELADAVPGGIFVLFTSRAQMDRVHRALTARVTDRPIFKQGDAAPLALIAKFKAAENGMLLGTDTFWQGVDVPGKALRCVVIARLPFAVPTEPMEETRQEWLAKQGKNPFMADTVPRAVIKFRQGFGRLIRTHDDIGCVAVLDPRAETKSYGRTFLKSLPPCRRVKTVDALKLFFQDADGRDRA